MDQDSSSNPVTPAPTAPVSDMPAPDTPVPNPAAVFAPPVSTTGDSPVVTPDLSLPNMPDATTSSTDIPKEVIKKIAESQNVLIALSSDPSVDEISAAIGLSLFLDKLDKRATAIYSGSTPNALEFLKPEDTFESSADTLQDFVIALNKDKADHLRYKLDGDYVKIFITPYKTRISEEDLEFSYGDYNVDLVLALDVANGIDLDSALREHGRIMHDAVIVNITTGNPGRFGEIEWSDKSASSVSEMIAKLLYGANSKTEIGKEEATAFLTGIVAATNRFSNAKTTPVTMEIASRLMQSGANQQLISKNITPDVDNELYSLLGDNAPKRDTDPTKLDIEHEHKESSDEPKEETTDEPDKEETPATEESSALLDDLKAAEASLAQAGSETVPDTSNQPVKLGDTAADTSTVEKELKDESLPEEPILPEVKVDSDTAPKVEELAAPSTKPTPAEPSTPPPVEPVLPPVAFGEPTSEPTPDTEEEKSSINNEPEKVIQPSPDADLSSSNEGSEKYGKMLEDAIAGLGGAPASSTPADNPASAMAPQVASAPEINGVPEMNYMPMPGEEVLPPPPTPPIDMSTPAPEAPATPVEPIQPVIPPIESTPTSLGSQPAMQDQVYAPQVSDPGAFKIPGM